MAKMPDDIPFGQTQLLSPAQGGACAQRLTLAAAGGLIFGLLISLAWHNARGPAYSHDVAKMLRIRAACVDLIDDASNVESLLYRCDAMAERYSRIERKAL